MVRYDESNANWSIVKPTIQMAAELAELGKTSFEQTFVGMSYYTAGLVAGYTSEAFHVKNIAAELEDPRTQYLILYVGHRLAGYAKLVEGESPACLDAKRAVYLQRIYLLQEFQGQGLGRHLLDAVYDEARARTYEYLWLSVWEHNTRAIEFYHHLGFQKVGDMDWRFQSNGKAYVDNDYVMLKQIDKLIK